MVLAAGAGNAARSAVGVLVVVVIAGWALMFAVLFGMLIYLTVLRGRRQSRKRMEPAPAFSADPNLPTVLAQARHADPYFDEQLLLDASQLICLVMFAATRGAPRAPPGCSAYKSRAAAPVRAARRGFPWTTKRWPLS
jgi:hypothetical protein